MITHRCKRNAPTILIRIALLFTLAAMLIGAPAAANDEKDTFSIVVLPDTQYYSFRCPEVFRAQTEWIRSNVEKENILFVIGEGDITDTNSEREWAEANAAVSVLDGVVPYTLAVGNHDMGERGRTGTREVIGFNATFPYTRYENQDWYGGHFGDGNQNNYCFFSYRHLEFMVLSLEFGPPDEVLEWANEVVANHKDKRVIVVTHCYLNCDDTRVGDEDPGNPQDYPIGGNTGERIWKKFVSRHANIFLVLSGHIVCDESAAKLTSRGTNGNRVCQLLINYQDRPNGGNGWLRIIKFIPEHNMIEVVAYSPYLNRYNEGIRHTFTIWGYTMRPESE